MATNQHGKVAMADPDAERRRQWIAFHRSHAKAYEAVQRVADQVAAAGDVTWREPDLPSLPDHLRGLKCGARTRGGRPCRRADLHANGRCKLHGGPSSGAKTPEGRERAFANLSLRWIRQPMSGGQGKADAGAE